MMSALHGGDGGEGNADGGGDGGSNGGGDGSGNATLTSSRWQHHGQRELQPRHAVSLVKAAMAAAIEMATKVTMAAVTTAVAMAVAIAAATLHSIFSAATSWTT
jgi:hypothetical protein